MTDQLLKEAELLLANHRPQDAEKKIRQALASDPEHAPALAALAWCLVQQEKYADALLPARQAVAAAPDEPYFLFVLGYALLFNNQVDKARETVQSALQLAPDSAELFYLLAQIEYHERNWELALHNAERGLDFDPDNDSILNLRAMILVKLNRTAEAGHTVDSALYQNPQNAYAHANKGWVQVEKGDYKQAQASFLEALRLDPLNEHAREGLKESIKAQNLLYRVILRYFLWVNKLSETNQWLVVIGAYVAFRIVRSLEQSHPEWAPFLTPLIVLYLIFAYSSWIARPVSNLFLRLHPLGKHALGDDEKQGSTLIGACLGASALSLLAGWALGNGNYFLIGGILLMLTVPAGGMYSAHPGRSARRNLRAYAIFMALAGLTAVAGVLLNNEGVQSLGFGAFIIGALAYGWVANYLLMRDAKRF